MSSATTATLSRADEILNVAQDLIQTQGYNGFSYRDIAAMIGIKSASVHYHFPTKGDLGQAVAARYCDRFAQILQSLTDTKGTTQARLKGYVNLFRDTLVERDRLCMCGMLASEIETLPEVVKAEVARFFNEQQRWLSQTLQQGIDTGEIVLAIPAEAWATTFLAALEGGMLVSRGLGNNDHFDVVSHHLLTALLNGKAHER